jgi:hypothetical protein
LSLSLSWLENRRRRLMPGWAQICDRTAVYSAPRRDATDYPRSAHFLRGEIRVGNHCREHRIVMGPGKLMISVPLFDLKFLRNFPRGVLKQQGWTHQAAP